jgi:pimeloyl-ACP methyl ester carboxylesterase
MGAATEAEADVFANGVRQPFPYSRSVGRPLIHASGIPCPAVTWGFVVEGLSHEFDLYVLDVRGPGLSQNTPELDYHLDF